MGISLFESCRKGIKTLQLCCDFFLLEKKFETLIYYVSSHYSKRREDASMKELFVAAREEIAELLYQDYFNKNSIGFEIINHDDSLPQFFLDNLLSLPIFQEGLHKKKVILIISYSFEKDINSSLLNKPSSFHEMKKELAIPEIDLIIRTLEMRMSNGPIYAISQAQLLILDKTNPEVTQQDLLEMYNKYKKALAYRIESNIKHKEECITKNKHH